MIRNAKIESAYLGYEDHGIPTFSLGLSFDGSGQHFGNYDLRYSGHGVGLLFAVLDTVGVREWGKLVGKVIRVDGDMAGIQRIGHVIEDKWLDPPARARAADGD